MPTARQPSKEIAGVLLVVALAAYATSAAFLAAPAAPVPQVLQVISRPWDLLPAALFLFAAIAFRSRFLEEKKGGPRYDYSLFIVSSLNVPSHVPAPVSCHLLYGPISLPQLTHTIRY